MREHLKSRIKRAGLPPGTLLPNNGKGEGFKISIVEYSPTLLIEKEDVTVKECIEYIEKPTMTWIQIYGVNDPAMIASIGSRFNLHALVMEDVLSTFQRPKLDIYDEQVFIVVRSLEYEKQKKELKDEQVSIIYGSNFLICFLEQDKDIFAPIKERLKQPGNRLCKQGPDYLAYSMLDMIVDNYFVVLEKVDVNLDRLEEELVRSPKSDTLMQIQNLKREMVFLRKAIWPMRDVVNRFQRLDPPQVSNFTQLFLRDVYDHTIQAIDIVEGFRDVASGMLDIYLSNINIRTNDIMKVLTVVSTIFVPLTFITSLYGMNFEHMPELHSKWGYPLVLGMMFGVASVMLYFFHRKKWL
ncbi:MAG: magnesium/cobalt transporter CorA [Parachlamydia sp.]|jgi:magnesium transporter|nr:magnesium/cobalt transporter CorA [Parachlamydia sp.]